MDGRNLIHLEGEENAAFGLIDFSSENDSLLLDDESLPQCHNLLPENWKVSESIDLFDSLNDIKEAVTVEGVDRIKQLPDVTVTDSSAPNRLKRNDNRNLCKSLALDPEELFGIIGRVEGSKKHVPVSSTSSSAINGKINNLRTSVDWCTLPDIVILLIARRLLLFEDFIAFRSACSSWRKATNLGDFCTSSSSCPKPPVLMSRLALKRREFTSLSKGRKTCKVWMPEASCKDMENECIGSKGWLIMVERCTTGYMSLFHPLTRVQIPLPKAPREVKIPIWPKEFMCAALSASPSETSDYVVMVVFLVKTSLSESDDYTWFWKPGNKTWTRVEIPYHVVDLNYYNGKFYALTSSARLERGYRICLYQVWMCDVCGPNQNNNKKAIKITELPWITPIPKAQLVECLGRLLVVSPCSLGYDKSCLYDLKMVEIDVIKGSYKTITSLGSTSAVFLGRNQGFSVDSNKFPGIIQPNMIYFANGFIERKSYNYHAADGPGKTSISNYGWGIWINF